MVAINHNRFGARDAQPLGSIMGDAKSILDGLFGPSDKKDLPALAQAQIEATQRVREIAARIFATPDGEELLEALCDAALRRPFTLPPTAATADQRLAYADQREGQAQVVYMLLAWIAEGRSEQPPQREGSHAKSIRPQRERKPVVKPASKRKR
jgi:enoyl-CoA hydratase/carnithine racemase